MANSNVLALPSPLFPILNWINIINFIKWLSLTNIFSFRKLTQGIPQEKLYIIYGLNFNGIEMEISWSIHDLTKHLVLKPKTNGMWQAEDKKN